VPGLGTTYGRGGATSSPKDLLNSDAILIMGSNMAENHPVGFQWVMEAKEQHGTKVIHVDPRFSRTSAVANIWVPLRAGSDILFLGALIRYVLEHELFFREYVVHYTNASVIIPEDFRDTEELEGVFSGWNAEKKSYDPKSWLYERVERDGQAKQTASGGAPGGHAQHGANVSPDLNGYKQDLTLQHPRCVFQLLRKHFARYTPEMVEQYCGLSKDAFLHAARTFCAASGPDKTGAICYALGWTQHSSGVQMIRCAAILQLLLGNMGRPGGGILALRGHASIQGSTDVPTLYDILPGYLSMPKFGEESKSLADYIAKYGARTGWWNNLDKYIVSLLKAYYGEAAQPENDFGFHWLPRITGIIPTRATGWTCWMERWTGCLSWARIRRSLVRTRGWSAAVSAS
jgi:formate dehydrogenase major subunit